MCFINLLENVTFVGSDNCIIKMKKLKASALPTVMVISVLVCLFVLFAFTLFDINALFYANYHSKRQQKENLNSAFVLYDNDSSLVSSLENSNYEYQLYKDEPSSVVHFAIRPWGFYESVCVHSISNDYHSIRLLGKTQDCEEEAALWVCSRDMALSLAGTTRIDGPVFAPINGINNIQLGNTPFSGKEIDNSDIHLAEKELPDVDSVYLKQIESLRKWEKVSSFPSQDDKTKQYYSFKEETSRFALPRTTEGLVLRGNLMLYADEVTISKESVVSDVILVARKVIVEAGFVGSLQILASDTVILKEHVQLRYPSGIYLKGNESKTYLNIGSKSCVEGYAIVFGSVERGNSLTVDSNYRQESDAVFHGLLYVDGIADINGTLLGAVYVKECYYLPENGIYAGTLYNVKIARDKQIAYPFFFKKSEYRREEIKSVY